MQRSPDPAIKLLQERRDSIATELERLLQFLSAYTACTPVVEPFAMIDLEEHYSFLDDVDCGCTVCVDWTQRRKEFVDALTLIPEGHKWTVCGCPDCRLVGRFQLNFLAASNRRDLVIEMSFHARYHSHHGAEVMLWLNGELLRPEYNINWLAQECSRYPMERWLNKCEAAVGPMISGAVFCDAAGVTSFRISSNSSLESVVDVSSIAGYMHDSMQDYGWAR